MFGIHEEVEMPLPNADTAYIDDLGDCRNLVRKVISLHESIRQPFEKVKKIGVSN